VNKNSFVKVNIINNLSKSTGFSNSFSKKLINDLINVLIESIKNNEFILKNIGTFKIIIKKERIGRNPKTKDEFIISSRKSISFKAAKKIINTLNKN
jgi:integration host factor subunit alpha